MPDSGKLAAGMNYLAHLALAPRDDDSIVGTMLGDFVKGAIGDRYPGRVAEAIRLHRRLDAFTDSHPVVKHSRDRVAPVRRRYAGIMVDLFYDHFLARHWADYYDETLSAFSHRIYALLDRRRDGLPEALQRVSARMAERDWLGAYSRREVIGRALEGIGTRLKRGNGLIGAGEDLERAYEGFEADFRQYFPDSRNTFIAG